MQQTVGKNMTPLTVRAKLNFINPDEISAHAFGHRLDRTNPIGRTLGYNAFFASDQGDNRRPPHGYDLVINLSGKQPQWQPHDTRPMPQHPLDRIMRLAGVCRPEDRNNTRGHKKGIPLG
jgi:hypothetical protein